MEILYLIGNGLDIAQGMNTRYSDFYKKYSKPYEIDIHPAAKKLRAEIDKDYTTWADMELSFGKYTENITETDIEDVYYDLSDSMRDYLIGEQDNYKVTESAVESAKNDLITPYASLLERDKEEFLGFIRHLESQNIHNSNFDININAISFNYTNILEQLLAPFRGKQIGNIFTHRTFLRNICHIHGTLDGAMIMGVNDNSQIHNEAFKKDSAICDMLIKPQSNEATRSNNDIVCERLINKADIIIIFGMSLGETDKTWWQSIGSRIATGRAKLIIFEHIIEPLDYRRIHKLGAMRQNVISKFTSHLGFNQTTLEIIEENTYINFNTDFLARK